ncbi:TonB-dependent receptor family protein [Halomonas nitroreducens]|uniref:TonB-dependent siderophore receptor n=1 Tax=Halomonas nitroreducens TaxID=447425 RepID=A0A3S0HM74_9GAMM|nr:TonB-dependent siderophore receptor [Halomonas nitroreducens]RTQ98193.1 TonB-dependent siderophore receptor [Halomonas nitroreducens]
MLSRFRLAPLTAALLGASLSIPPAWAVEELTLDTLVVSSDWLGATQADPRTTPGGRQSLGEETLEAGEVRNLEDALARVPGVHVQDETGTGILPNIGVRGLSPRRSERVQILVDGIPAALGPYSNIGVSLFPVTLSTLERVDVVRGGAAVHYGPNNVGGVLNFVTRGIPYEAETQLRERLTVDEATGHVLTDSYIRAGGQVSERLGLQVQANLVRGEAGREHSDTEVDNFIVDGEYLIDDAHSLAGQLQYYGVDAELPGALSPEAFEQDRSDSQRPHDRFEADTWRGHLTWRWQPNEDVDFSWRHFGHHSDRTFWFGQSLGTGFHWADPAAPTTHVADSPRPFRVWASEPRLALRRGDHTLMLGARYLEESVDFDVNRRELATGTTSEVRRWDFETQAVAAYVSDTWRLGDSGWTLTPGLRYEHAEMDFADALGGGEDDNLAEEWLPGLTVGFEANDAWYLFATSQRSLTPVQLAQVTNPGDVANETAWNHELGARYTAGAWQAEATGFVIDYEDQIVKQPDNSLKNLGRTRYQGLEARLAWAPVGEPLSLEGTWTWLDTEQRDGEHAGNEVPNAPEHLLNLHAGWTQGDWTWNLNGRYVAESFSDAANTEEETADGSAGELPDYWQVDTSLAYRLPVAADASLTLGVHNLTDHDAFFRGVDVSPVGRVPLPGRAYSLGLDVTF